MGGKTTRSGRKEGDRNGNLVFKLASRKKTGAGKGNLWGERINPGKGKPYSGGPRPRLPLTRQPGGVPPPENKFENAGEGRTEQKKSTNYRILQLLSEINAFGRAKSQKKGNQRNASR